MNFNWEQNFLEGVVPKILGQLCSGNMSPTQHLETQQALVKQLAEILEFVLKFDEHKMKTPAIQNDFSYYRRTLTRASLTHQGSTEKDLVVGNELANRMSLFYAHATPMLRVLSHATITFLMMVSKKKERKNDIIDKRILFFLIFYFFCNLWIYYSLIIS